MGKFCVKFKEHLIYFKFQFAMFDSPMRFERKHQFTIKMIKWGLNFALH